MPPTCSAEMRVNPTFSAILRPTTIPPAPVSSRRWTSRSLSLVERPMPRMRRPSDDILVSRFVSVCSTWFLLHRRGEVQRGKPQLQPVFPFVEACLATLSARRYRGGRYRARSGVRHRLCGTWSSNGRGAQVRDKHALPWGRAPWRRGRTPQHRAFRRDETGHRLSPPARPPSWAVRPVRRSRCQTLHRPSVGVTVRREKALDFSG